MSTILIVDDDADIRNLLRLVLEDAGHIVVEAPHGKAALEIIQPDPLPDVVVTDLMMPVLSGAELIERLRAEQRTAAIPIVVVSGSDDSGTALRAAGRVQAVVRKPFNALALAACIANLAGGSGDAPPYPEQLAI